MVLVGFFAALVPICTAIVFTMQTLGELADKNRELTKSVVNATRLGQEIQRDVLELERRARQQIALNEPQLAGLFSKELELLADKLHALQTLMPTNSPDIEGLLHSLGQLSLMPDPNPALEHAPQLEAEAMTTVVAVAPAETPINGEIQATLQDRLNHEFSVIYDQSKAIRSWLLASVDQLLEQAALEADYHIDSLLVQLSVLAAATLGLLLLFAYLINKPVRDLTEEIHQLGTAGLSHAIEISGPLELQALGTELEALRKDLHESEQQKQQFLRHISHELKTPLASLREGADLLSEQVTGHLSQQQLEIVDIVRTNGIELQRLIENLIDYNHLPQQDLKIDSFDVRELWRELLPPHRISVNKKGLQLQTQGAAITWRADRYKLKTSLDNLLSNAVNYTPVGGKIDIVWRRERDQLLIDVANSGEPIPTNDAEQIFEPFFQSAAKRSGPIKGSGIGLSVARECVEAQGGTLSLVPHKGLPICFRLQCPHLS